MMHNNIFCCVFFDYFIGIFAILVFFSRRLVFFLKIVALFLQTVGRKANFVALFLKIVGRDPL